MCVCVIVGEEVKKLGGVGLDSGNCVWETQFMFGEVIVCIINVFVVCFFLSLSSW